MYGWSDQCAIKKMTPQIPSHIARWNSFFSKTLTKPLVVEYVFKLYSILVLIMINYHKSRDTLYVCDEIIRNRCDKESFPIVKCQNKNNCTAHYQKIVTCTWLAKTPGTFWHLTLMTIMVMLDLHLVHSILWILRWTNLLIYHICTQYIIQCIHMPSIAMLTPLFELGRPWSRWKLKLPHPHTIKVILISCINH